MDADGVCTGHGVALYALLNASALERRPVESSDGYGTLRIRMNAADLFFRNGDIHLYLIYIEHGHHGLRRHDRFPRLDELAPHHTAYWSEQAAVVEVLAGNVACRLCLREFALRLHPLHFGETVVVVQIFHTVVCILRLR